MRLVFAILVFLAALSPESSFAVEQNANCGVSSIDLGKVDCGGTTTDGEPGTVTIGLRRTTAQGVVDPKIIQLRELTERGEEVPIELLNEVCTGPALPETQNLCWVATPVLAGPAGPTPQQQAQEFVETYFKRLPLPIPKPKMSSEKGLCGGIHTIDLGIDDEYIFTSDTPQGPLTLHVYGTAHVNWGDGTSGNYDITSKIPHTWTTKGEYDITSLVAWTADWSVEGVASGQVGGAFTTGTQENWPVWEMQAVAING